MYKVLSYKRPYNLFHKGKMCFSGYCLKWAIKIQNHKTTHCSVIKIKRRINVTQATFSRKLSPYKNTCITQYTSLCSLINRTFVRLLYLITIIIKKRKERFSNDSSGLHHVKNVFVVVDNLVVQNLVSVVVKGPCSYTPLNGSCRCTKKQNNIIYSYKKMVCIYPIIRYGHLVFVKGHLHTHVNPYSFIT